MISNVTDVKQLGTILGVWAHPDDETFLMAGIITAALRNGQTVACITATRGEAGFQDENRWPAAKLSEIRTAELQASYKILGITNHQWLDYPDGGCKTINHGDAVKRLAEVINTYQPDSILTFGPDGYTGHDDHKAVSAWAILAAKHAHSSTKVYQVVQTDQQYQNMVEADKKFNIFFNIDRPPLCEEGQCAIHFVLPDNLYELKLAALSAMPSQTENILKMFAHKLRSSWGIEAFVEADMAK